MRNRESAYTSNIITWRVMIPIRVALTHDAFHGVRNKLADYLTEYIVPL